MEAPGLRMAKRRARIRGDRGLAHQFLQPILVIRWRAVARCGGPARNAYPRALPGEAKQGRKAFAVQPIYVHVDHGKHGLAVPDAAVRHHCLLQEGRRDPQGMIAEKTGRPLNGLQLPVVVGGRSAPFLGQHVAHPVVFEREVYRHVRVGPALLDEIGRLRQVGVEGRKPAGEPAVRTDVRGRVEGVGPAGRIVGHAVPDDVVDAVGEHRVRHELQVLHLLLAVMGRRRGPRRVAVDAGEGLAGHDGPRAQGRRRPGDGREEGLEKQRLGFRDVHEREGGQQVRWRPVALHAAHGTEAAAEVGIGPEETLDRRVRQDLPVVVPHIGMLVDRCLERFQFVPEAIPKDRIQVRAPEPIRIDLPRIGEQRRGRAAQGRFQRAADVAGVPLQRVRVQVVQDPAPAVVGKLPRLLQPLVRSPAEYLARVLLRHDRPAEGPGGAEGEVAPDTQPVRLLLGAGDQAGPRLAQPARSFPGPGLGIHEGDLHPAEPLVPHPFELAPDVFHPDVIVEPPPARVGTGVRKGPVGPGQFVRHDCAFDMIAPEIGSFALHNLYRIRPVSTIL